MVKDESIQKFLDGLASSAPTPGGGSAAGVMGAMGAGLVSMVANLTIGKKNYAHVEADMKDLLARAEALRDRLTATIQADVETFGGLMSAFGMPKDSDEQKAARSAAIQSATVEATRAPLLCARLAREVMEISREAADKGNVNVVSDAGVAVLAAYAALKSAALNVFINLPSIKDPAFSAQARSEIDAALAGADELCAEIYGIVRKKIGG